MLWRSPAPLCPRPHSWRPATADPPPQPADRCMLLLLPQWLAEKEQERLRREEEQRDMVGAVTRWLEKLGLASKEEMVREYIGELGGTADLARLDEDDLKDLMIDLDLEKGSKEAEAFEQAVKDLDE